MIIKETKTKSILTKSDLPVSDYSANPYIGCAHACKYCYACFMKRFTNHSEPWGDFVDVKYWPPVKNAAKYCGKEIFIGSVTDPYQPAEEKYERTRALLENLKKSGAKISIATKSDLILRDIKLIKAFPEASVSWSVNTLDEGFRGDMDRAASIERRLHAMEAFHREGINTVCFISPIFPGITDLEAIIKRVKGICGQIWLENLNLRGSYKASVMNYIRSKYPSLVPLYESIYVHGDKSYWTALDKKVRTLAESEKLLYTDKGYDTCGPAGESPVIVNFFYHELIKKSAKNKQPL